MELRKLLALTVSSVVPKLLSVVALPIIVSRMPPSEYADYAAIVSLSTIVLPLLVWGADNYAANISFEQLPAYTKQVYRHLLYTSVALLALAMVLGQSAVAWAVLIAASMAALNIFSANVVRHSGTMRIMVLIALPSLTLEIWRLSAVFLGLGPNPLLLGHSSYALIVLIVSLIFTWPMAVAEYRFTKAYWSFAFARSSSQLLNNVSIQALPLLAYQTFDKSLSGILFASLTLLSTPYSVLGKKQVYLFNDEMKKNRSAHWVFLASNITIYAIFVVALLLVPKQFIPAEWREFKIFVVPLSIYSGTIFFLNTYLQLPTISGKHRNLFFFPMIRLSTLILSIVVVRISDLGLNGFLWIYSIAVAFLAMIVATANVKTFDR